MRKNRALHTLFVFVLTFGMIFSVANIPSSALQATAFSDKSGAKVDKISSESKPESTSDQSEQDEKDPNKLQGGSWRDTIRVYSSYIYPAGEVYYSGISAGATYPSSSPFTTYRLTKAKKDELIAQYKKLAKSDPTGWEVKITFLIQTVSNIPAHLYLKLNGVDLDPIVVQDGDLETISYYTVSEASDLSGYIRYSGGGTEAISTGILYSE
ncbi:hypothetical protein [Caproiciproducens sp.]